LSVVLPFLNLSADARQDYLSDGITDSLTTDLMRALPGSFVVSRDTAFTYKGKAVDVRQIGRELDVRYVLEGSVLPDGDLVRVNAQLIDAATGGHLWAERFDLKRKDILQVQDDIVGRLSRAIGLKMIDRSAAKRARKPRPRGRRPHHARQGDRRRPASPATMARPQTCSSGRSASSPKIRRPRRHRDHIRVRSSRGYRGERTAIGSGRVAADPRSPNRRINSSR
jgi:TolB-like protein